MINYKTIIAPIVGVIVLMLNTVFGYNIGQEVGDQIIDVLVNLIAVVFTVYGIFKNHIKKKEVVEGK